MKVGIIGGGVAGSAAALAMRRIGVEVTVREAYADPAGPVGSFVSLAANGLRGLRALGVLEDVQRDGTRIARQRMYSTTGKLLGDVPRGRARNDELHSVTLLRADLVKRLREAAARAGAEIVTGQRVATVDQVDADLIIGADGIWSVARDFVDPDGPAPKYAGLYSVSGSAHGVDVEPDTFAMTFARAGAFLHLRAADGSVWWSAQVAGAEPGQVTLYELRHRYRHEAVPSAILRAAQGFQPPAKLHTRPPVRRWHRDNVLLIGDAAHPVGAGQGAAMAVEDAVVLAQQLTSRPLAEAFPAFAYARRGRVHQLVKTAAKNRDAKTAGPISRRVRDLVMPIVVPRFFERATAWLYEFDPGELRVSSNDETPAVASTS